MNDQSMIILFLGGALAIYLYKQRNKRIIGPMPESYYQKGPKIIKANKVIDTGNVATNPDKETNNYPVEEKNQNVQPNPPPTKEQVGLDNIDKAPETSGTGIGFAEMAGPAIYRFGKKYITGGSAY
jgi:hypothetical protein